LKKEAGVTVLDVTGSDSMHGSLFDWVEGSNPGMLDSSSSGLLYGYD
jgi:hypothetical protein